MRTVTHEDLRPGEPLAHALYTRSGRLLAHSGTVWTAEMAGVLEGGGIELRFDTRAEPVSAREGRPRPDDSRDERRMMRVRADIRRSAADVVGLARTRWEKMPLGVEVGADPVLIDRDARGGAAEELLRDRRAGGVGVVRGVIARLLDGEHVGIDGLAEVADDLVDAIARNAARYSIMALGLPRPVDSLPDHAYSTGALAIGMAAQLGWPRADVRMVGVTGFLCDAGVGLVPHAVRQAGRPLTEIEINAVRRHPEYSVALARRVGGLPDRAALAIFQHHERLDGTGYPLGSQGGVLHDYARVLAVADAFAGMASPRAHRPAMTPGAAMSEVAHLAGAGALDRDAVRALLDVLGMYPAGSYVRLSSGHIAAVGASSPPGASDRPVVRVVQPVGARTSLGPEIDLMGVEPERLRVVEAVRGPDSALNARR